MQIQSTDFSTKNPRRRAVGDVKIRNFDITKTLSELVGILLYESTAQKYRIQALPGQELPAINARERASKQF